jgi:flagellar hook protein FlgE
MMTQAFYTGISGIKTSQAAIDVTSNNIANVSTVGYRAYSSEFASMFESAINTGNKNNLGNTIGLGSTLQTTTMMQLEGSVMNTERSTDLALYGEGWFGVLKNEETFYTRAGNFVFDENNDLVTPDGMYVLGTLANNIDGNTLTEVVNQVTLGDAGAQTTLRFPKTLNYPPEPTTEVSFFANLGVEDAVRTVGASIVDANGERNNLKLTFTKSEVQTPPGTQWDVQADITSLDGITIYATQAGVANFDESGALLNTTLTSIDNNGINVALNLGEEYSGIVSLNREYVPGSSLTNGTVGGELVGYEINRYAEVIATFTNGQQSSVGKVAVYHFQNDQGLERASGTLFRESSNSGEAIFYQDADGNNILGAEVLNYQLENSNVGLDVALTELIILQRSFDANSKSITTADQMMQKALSMDA